MGSMRWVNYSVCPVVDIRFFYKLVAWVNEF